jgi:hypothetical protein
LKKSLSVLLLLHCLACAAQKKIVYNNQQWIQYNNQLKLPGKLALISDISLRRIDAFSRWSQITFRTGLGYPLAENLQGVTGAACFTSYTNDALSRIEFRFFQEANMNTLFAKVSLQQRLRIEARFFKRVEEGSIQTETDFFFRFRYRLFAAIPVGKKKEESVTKFFLNIGNEVFINAGKEITYNTFDNNRFLLGATLELNKRLSFSLAYINQFGQRSGPALYENSDIAYLGITHKIGKQ